MTSEPIIRRIDPLTYHRAVRQDKPRADTRISVETLRIGVIERGTLNPRLLSPQLSPQPLSLPLQPLPLSPLHEPPSAADAQPPRSTPRHPVGPHPDHRHPTPGNHSRYQNSPPRQSPHRPPTYASAMLSVRSRQRSTRSTSARHRHRSDCGSTATRRNGWPRNRRATSGAPARPPVMRRHRLPALRRGFAQRGHPRPHARHGDRDGRAAARSEPSASHCSWSARSSLRHWRTASSAATQRHGSRHPAGRHVNARR